MTSAMRAASQLSGRGPTDVDVAPVPALNQKSDYDIYMIHLLFGSVVMFVRIGRYKNATLSCKLGRAMIQANQYINTRSC